MAEQETTPDDVIRFWLGDLDEPGADPLAKAQTWWRKDAAFDREIKERFEHTLDRGVRGELAEWETTPRGRLALVILYDQLSRNMFRATPRSFAQDALARAVATKAFETGDDRVLAPIEVTFLLMPFMHAEDVPCQNRCIEGFAKLRDEASDEKIRANFENYVKYARMHLDVVERFGRFPHRNGILERPSTKEESAFLKQPGSSF